jgi:hypothetical protein
MKITRNRIGLAVVVAAGALAAAIVGVIAPGSTASPDNRWTVNRVLGGTPIVADALAVDVARASAVNPGQLRRLVAAGQGRHRFSLVAGQGKTRTCFAVAGAGFMSQFHCGWPTSDEAVIQRLMTGGSSTEVVEHATLVGLARDDVNSLALTLADGSTRTLSLNAQNAFAYSAETAAELPSTLVARNGDGDVLQKVELAAAPPCAFGCLTFPANE